jgi:hypothetical protein
MFDYMPECPPITCRITRLFDASPEHILEAWRDPSLFLRRQADQPDAFVQFDISRYAEHRFAITFGHSDGTSQERLPLRVTCAPTEDEAGECDECESDCEDAACLTLAVAIARPSSQHPLFATPCTLSISSPRPEWTDDLAVALRSIAEALAAHLQRQRRGH